jgi:hypothetical protein
MTTPATKGYEIEATETRQFMRALGLDPEQVESVLIQPKTKRVIANLLDGDAIAIPIRDRRKP